MELQEAFVSELTGRSIELWTDGSSMPIGSVQDLVVDGRESFPPVTGIYVKCRDGIIRYAPFSAVRTMSDKAIILNQAPHDKAYAPSADDELLLNRELLDKQILDVDGRKVVRVNDLKLVPTGEHLRLIAVDVGLAGLLRRLGLHALGRRWLERASRPGLRQALISWDAVAPLSSVGPGDAVRLRLPHDRIERIHPADLAAIIEDLNTKDQASLLSSLPEDTAAEALEQLDVDTQLSILEDLQPDRAADIIENMSSDDAADLLGEVEPEVQQQLLGLMQPQEAQDVRELLGHDEDTAGGIMTTEYLSVPLGVTVAQTFEHIRNAAEDAELVYYIYVLNEHEHILGVLSLRDLLKSPPDAPITGVMNTDVVTVAVDASREEVATTIARYDFVAVPVVDDAGIMRGIITVDDVIDVLLPERLRKMIPRVGKSRSKHHSAPGG
ncbi:MAG TPA: CBS domain-containing protein [Candidatus Eremiobacteraceae bacterium]|nr:CBS domain-containing protein [Candidatus Eremiobacteraceae bacterium]